MKGQEVQIILEDDNLIFSQLHKLISEVQGALVQAWTIKLMDVNSVELSKGEHVLTIVTPTKNDIFGNWTKHYMCGDSYLLNKQMHLNKYLMPLLQEIFNALG